MTDQKNQNQKDGRVPIVSIMGHIDHGKSTLLEYIKKTNITDTEAGGITQQIGAYEVEIEQDGKKHKITFIDTPGHEAFSMMRHESARASDVAILVISAEEGFKAQTKEALECAKAHNLPIIIAMTKIDLPGADIERIKIDLAENGVLVESYGGDIPCVGVSGKTGEGINDLLELIILTAEINEVGGNKKIPADGFIIESNTDKKRGIAATLVIKNGILKSGTFIVAEKAFAPVRIMEDFRGKLIKEAGMGKPIKILGWNITPNPGSKFTTVKDKKEAEKLASESKIEKNYCPGKNLHEENEENTAILNVILKADTAGSLNALNKEIAKVFVPNVKIKIINQGIGDISESDAKLAISTDPKSLLGAFGVGIDKQAKVIIERETINAEVFEIIYKVSDWLKEKSIDIKPKIQVEEKRGEAKILKIFSKVKDKQVVGGRVIDGKINIGADVKIIRRGEELGKGKIKELQSQKTKTSEVQKNSEFGVVLDSKVTIAPGDQIEAFIIKEE